jgi:hypothetical protein
MADDIWEWKDRFDYLRACARARGLPGLRFGFVLESCYTHDGVLAFRLTTGGGERVWLTGALARALERSPVWLQGALPVVISSAHAAADQELVEDLWIEVRVEPSPAEEEYAVTLETRWVAGRSSPLMCLSTARPEGWPL